MKTATIYSRVSDPGQMGGLSPELQKELCQKWAKEKGYQVVGVYQDGGRSGTKTVGRDGLEDMIIQCQKEKVNAALVIDTDRIARNEVDHFSIKNELRKGGTQLIAINQPLNDTPEGQFLETILAGANAFYSRLLGRKVRKSLEKKCQMGDWPGWGPVGYTNVNRGTIEKPNNVIEVDPEFGSKVTEIFKLYSTNRYSVDNLVEISYSIGLRSKNGKKLCRNVLYAMLKNVFYTGYFKFKGELYKGNHEPLTTPEIFEACQRIMDIHNRHVCRRRKYKWLLNGLAFCQIHDSRLCGDWVSRKGRAYYHGNANKGCRRYLSLDTVEKNVAKYLQKIQFSDKLTNQVIEKAKELVKQSREIKQQEIENIRNAIKQLEVKRNALEDNLLDGTIDKEAFKRKHGELDIQIQNCDNEIATLENQGGLNIDVVVEIVSLMKNIRQEYEKASFEAKRHYLSMFFEKLWFDEAGNVVKSDYTPLFQHLVDNQFIRIRAIWLPRLDSNQQPSSYKNPSVTKRLGLSHHRAIRELGI